jgi:hypothetical protein
MGQSVTPGSRVRVTLKTTPPRIMTGTLDQVAGDTLHLRVKDEAQSGRTGKPVYQVMPLPVAAVGTIEVSRGRHSNVGTGVLIGGLAGVVAGLAGGGGGQGWDFGSDRGTAAALYGVTGAGWGALIGALTTRERWTVVPLTSLQPAPVTLNRVRIGVTLWF